MQFFSLLVSVGAVLAGLVLGFLAIWLFSIFGDRKAMAKRLAHVEFYSGTGAPGAQSPGWITAPDAGVSESGASISAADGGTSGADGS